MAEITLNINQCISQCISNNLIFEDTLSFTPPSGWFGGSNTMGESIVEDDTYIFIVFNDSQDGDYKHHQVYRYTKSNGNIDTKQITTTNGYYLDPHKLPTMMITSSGSLLVAIEQLSSTSTNSHNSYFDVFRWVDVSDLDVYSQDSLTSVYGSYPNLFEINNEIYLDFRHGQSSVDHYRRAYYKSTNDGVTWNTPVVDWVNYGDTDYWAYSAIVGNNVADKTSLIHMVRPLNNAAFPGAGAYNYITLVSTDFANTYAIDGTDLGAVVTGTELENNYTYGDTTKGTSNVSMTMKVFGDYIYGWAGYGTRIGGVVTVVGRQLIRVNKNTGAILLGIQIPTTTDYARNLFNMCGSLVAKVNIEGNWNYFKIPFDLGDVELLYTETTTDEYHAAQLYGLYNELSADYNKTTNTIRVFRFSDPDEIVTPI